jgi:hypothetical protein
MTRVVDHVKSQFSLRLLQSEKVEDLIPEAVDGTFSSCRDLFLELRVHGWLEILIYEQGDHWSRASLCIYSSYCTFLLRSDTS